MSFASLHFLIFFPIAVGLYFATPGKWRWATLLALSYYFYGSWRIEYLFLLMASTAVDYGAALGIAAATTQRVRRAWLGLSLTLNLGILFVFKYYAFFSESLRTVLAPFGVDPGPSTFHPLLPIGISFFTFQTLAYTIEVYKGRCQPERNVGKFALYVAFFPQLVAGPIERPQKLLPQFNVVHKFSGERVVSGLTRMAWGFFLKLVVADRVAVVVNDVFNNPAGQTAGSIMLATYLFTFQIYADFAGYTDIAIGSARVMGFDLMENFRRPYFATSITDFWRRWHISMTTWFRDYVFVPLGGARKGRVRAIVNIMIVFVASGLWHGAEWHYVLSGCLYAAFFLFGHVTRPARNALWASTERAAARVTSFGGNAVELARPWIARLITFHLVCLVFLMFRANTVADAMHFMNAMLHGAGGFAVRSAALNPYELAIAMTALLILLMHHLLDRIAPVDDLLVSKPVWIRWSALYGLATVTLLLGNFGTQPFIYFQF